MKFINKLSCLTLLAATLSPVLTSCQNEPENTENDPNAMVSSNGNNSRITFFHTVTEGNENIDSTLADVCVYQTGSVNVANVSNEQLPVLLAAASAG